MQASPHTPALRQAAAKSPFQTRRRPGADALGVLLALSPILVVISLFIVPLLVIVVYSVWTNTAVAVGPPWTLSNYTRFFNSPVYALLMLKSLRIAITLVALSIVFAFPVAYVIARVIPPHWRFIVLAAIMIPSLSSFLVRTYAFIIILNEHGPLNETLRRLGITDAPLSLLYNEASVFIGLLNVYIPWMVLPIYASLNKIDPTLYEAAENLGASRLQIWCHLVIPMSIPGVIAGAFLGFIPALGSYATPLILGGRGGLMFANTITTQFAEANDWPFGAALCVILLTLILLMMALYHRFGHVEQVWES